VYHTLAPVHAHISLLGFTLVPVFGVVYRVIPAMAGTGLAQANFWPHQVGAAVMLISLFLMMTGTVAEAVIGPVMPFAERALLLSILTFGRNLLQNAKARGMA
jgi:hypothetical protein